MNGKSFEQVVADNDEAIRRALNVPSPVGERLDKMAKILKVPTWGITIIKAVKLLDMVLHDQVVLVIRQEDGDIQMVEDVVEFLKVKGE